MVDIARLLAAHNGNNRIVGFAIGGHHDSPLATAALQMAVAVRGGRDVLGEVIMHTDQGSEGAFNWSSQHLDVEVFDGKKAAGCGSCAASEDAFAGQVGFPAAG